MRAGGSTDEPSAGSQEPSAGSRGGLSRRRVLAGTAWAVPTVMIAQAAPAFAASARWWGSTSNNVLGLNLNVVNGLSLANVELAHSGTAVSEQGSAANAANLAASVVGIGLGVATTSATAPPNSDPPSQTLGQVNLTGVLTTGVISGDTAASWDSKYRTATNDRATSTVGIAAPGVSVVAGTVATLGAASTAGTTTQSGGTVTSTSTGSLASLALLGGAVTVHISSNPTLTVTNNGTTSTVTYSPPTVTVTVGLTTTTLQPGVPLTLNAVLGSVTLTLGTLTNVVSSASQASADLDFLRAQVSLLTGTSATLDILQLHAEAHVLNGTIPAPPA